LGEAPAAGDDLFSDRAAPRPPPTHDHADEDHKHNGADHGGDDRADVEHPVHRVIASNLTDNPSAQKGANEPEQDVPDHAQTFVALNEQAGEPAGDCSYHDPCKPFHDLYLLVVPPGPGNFATPDDCGQPADQYAQAASLKSLSAAM
jgi:hypothetical protein